MKRIILFFAVCLGLSVSQTTFADDADTARAATKRGSANVSSTQSAGRAVTTNTKRADNSQNASKNTRTAAKSQQKVISRTTTNQQNVKPRASTVIKIPEKYERVSTTSHTASSRTVNSRQATSNTYSSGTKATRTAVSTTTPKRVSRATELNAEKITNIKSLDYSKCKTVYYECMDEFCANKDTNLRRCACSSRIHEFDSIKKQLSNAEDKMLDFNQRLLTVNLDKEDAAAINVATEGELAFQTKDTTESEKLLQKITKTLNSSGDSKINNDLSSISLSLDMDTAWDDVDSLSGVATSAKNGVDLYNAASPVCVAMAREVCNDDELAIAQSGYKLTIQQDCDTVSKYYKTQYNSAMEKIHESGALLDMSRLNIHQQRNSDDTLTCKKKILTQLSDASVCGENLYKCLDTTGQYIDPSTGAAFLSEDLYKLTDLLQEPVSDERWSKIAQNESFVNFLNSKKKFLEPATEQCQDISDTVWKEFLDDALAQIKLAQNSKLEEIRHSCTTLVAECKTGALESLSDFDARALSTFSVAADKTANKMCLSIENACNGVMSNNGISTDWKEGISGISADISYKKVIDACTQIGRDCIVQQCNGTSGNFALCQKTTDDNRRAILNRSACWDKVLECVSSADNIDSMTVPERSAYYNSVYGLNANSIPDACADNPSTACLITEQIWGNCEYTPTEYSITTNESLVSDTSSYRTHNQILVPNTGSSLLSWFAANTGTTESKDSCNSNGCPINYERTSSGRCQQLYAESGTLTTDGRQPTNANQIINVTNSITNYCKTGKLDLYGNCCTGSKSNGICVPEDSIASNGTTVQWQAARFRTITCSEVDDYLCPVTGSLTLYCVTKSASQKPIVYYTNYSEYACGATDSGGFEADSLWILVDSNGNYINPDQSNNYVPRMFYRTSSNACCIYKYNDSTNAWYWEGTTCVNAISSYPTNNEFLIEYVTGESLQHCSVN